MAHTCPMCSDFTAPTFQLLQVHLFRVHSGNFDVTCCQARFKSASAYRKHIQRHHRSSQCDGLPSSTGGFDEDPSEVEGCGSDDVGQTPVQVKENTAMWILKIKETHKLTQTCVDSMLQEVTELCTVNGSVLGGAVDSVLQSAGLKMEEIPGLRELFAPSSPYCRPFDGLDTYHRQLAFYKSHLKFVVSSA